MKNKNYIGSLDMYFEAALDQNKEAEDLFNIINQFFNINETVERLIVIETYLDLYPVNIELRKLHIIELVAPLMIKTNKDLNTGVGFKLAYEQLLNKIRTKLDEYLLMAPCDLTFVAYSGIYHYWIQDYDTACNILNYAFTQKHKNSLLIHIYAFCLIKQKGYVDATNCLKEINSDNLENSMYIYASLLLEVKEYNECIRVCETILSNLEKLNIEDKVALGNADELIAKFSLIKLNAETNLKDDLNKSLVEQAEEAIDKADIEKATSIINKLYTVYDIEKVANKNTHDTSLNIVYLECAKAYYYRDFYEIISRYENLRVTYQDESLFIKENQKLIRIFCETLYRVGKFKDCLNEFDKLNFDLMNQNHKVNYIIGKSDCLHILDRFEDLYNFLSKENFANLNIATRLYMLEACLNTNKLEEAEERIVNTLKTFGKAFEHYAYYRANLAYRKEQYTVALAYIDSAKLMYVSPDVLKLEIKIKEKV